MKGIALHLLPWIMPPERPPAVSARSVRSSFLRFSAVMSAVLLCAIGAPLVVQFQIQRSAVGLEEVALPNWHAALQLEADSRALSVHVARLPLAMTLAEARTVHDMVSGGLALIEDTLGSGPGKLNDALTSTLNEIRHTAELAFAATERRIEVARDVDQGLLPADRLLEARRSERDLARRLDDLGLTLASHAAIATHDSENAFRAQREQLAQQRWLQAALLIGAGLLVGVLMFAQYRLVDRRLLRRIARLRDGMMSGTVEAQRLRSGSPRDELDQMTAELGALLDRLSDQNLELQRLAASDPLTGLANRRTLMDRLRFELERAFRYRRPLSLLMIDIDHFKSINDNWGHATGDQVLARIAGALGSETRHSDLLARHGGEEFVLLLPETDQDAAAETAELLRARVAGLQIDVGGAPLQVTISVGCASLRPGDRMDDLVERADLAMYAAKRKGRNRVECAPSSLSLTD